MNPRKMINQPEMADEQFRLLGLEILQRELGTDGAARFLRIAQSGAELPVDYTRDRHKWLKGVTVRQIADDIEKLRKRSA